MNKFTSISTRLATLEDAHLPVFDNTKLVALDTCVRWGILSYQMHKKWVGSKKAQALDAGTALHDVFAAVRLWQLIYYDLGVNSHLDVHKDPEFIQAVITKQGTRLFGNNRWFELGLAESFMIDNSREQLIDFCMQVLHTSGYEEDPEDKKRTMSALEEVAINYINRWDMNKYPVWVRDANDPNTDVGIEIGYDCVIEYEVNPNKQETNNPYPSSKVAYRFTGKLDGLHYDPQATNPNLTQGALFVVDNKTTSRLTEDWGTKYDMDTQMRGYMLAATVFTGEQIHDAKVIASSLPVPAKSTHGGQAVHSIMQPAHMFMDWYEWFYNLAQVEQVYKDDPINSPRSPHSCVRYFKPCPMIPYCVASPEEKLEAIEQMETYKWNVLATAED